jgi:hypothetical protein
MRKDGTQLPGPRHISLSLIPDVNNPDLRYSHLLMQFGQFIDHDLSHVIYAHIIHTFKGKERRCLCCGSIGIRGLA